MKYRVLTWSQDSGEDAKGEFSTKARAVQDMRQRVKLCGYDGACVIDIATRQAVAVYGEYPRFTIR